MEGISHLKGLSLDPNVVTPHPLYNVFIAALHFVNKTVDACAVNIQQFKYSAGVGAF